MISRYDSPAQQNVQNTYVPIPYAELYNSLQHKQKEYDFLKDTTEKSDNAIMAIQAPQFIRTSNDYNVDGRVENPQYQILRQNQEQLAKEKQDLLNSGVDFTTPEGKQAISQYIRKASSFMNGPAKQIQQDSNNILQHNKNYEEYLSKGVSYQGNALSGDSNVDNFLQKGAGFSVVGLNPYQDRIDIVKKAIDPIKSQSRIVRDKNGIQTFEFNGVPIATLRNGRTIVEGVGKQKILQALNGVVGSELQDNLDREAKSKVQYLLGKNSDKIYDKDGSVKEVDGKPATEYYYNKYLNDEYKKLADYAVSIFESSKIDDTQSNKFLPESFQVGGANDANRPDLTRPLYMGEGVINVDETPDYNKAPKDHILPPLYGGSNTSFGISTGGSGIPSPDANKQAKLEKAQKGDPKAVHEYWETADPYYKQVSEAYKTSKGKRPLSNDVLTRNDLEIIKQTAIKNRQTLQSSLNVPLSDEYQGDRLDKDLVARNALNGAAVIRDQSGNILTKEDLRKQVTSENDASGTSATKNLSNLINSYQLPVGKQPAGYNVNLGGKNYYIEYSNPKSKRFNDSIKEVTSNIYDIKQPATKEVNIPEFMYAGFNQELQGRGIDPNSVKNVKFTTDRNDLNIDDSNLVMHYTINGANKTIKIPMFGEGSVTELTKYISPLTGNTRDITSGNLPKGKTPEYDNQEFED